jgi:hypothetical protein
VPVRDAVERRYPILAARDRLSVDDAGPGAQLGDRLDDERESVGQVIARPSVSARPSASVRAAFWPRKGGRRKGRPLLFRRSGGIMRVTGGHWLEYDSVAVAVLVIGTVIVLLVVLSI